MRNTSNNSANRVQQCSRGLAARMLVRGFCCIHGIRERDLTIFCGEPIVFDFDIEAEQPPTDAKVGISLRVTTTTGEYLVTMDSVVQRAGWIQGEEKSWNVRCDLGRLPLNEGAYFVWVTVCVYVDNTVKRFARFTNAFALHVLENDVFGWGSGLPRSRYWGPLYWAPKWQIQPVEPETRDRSPDESRGE